MSVNRKYWEINNNVNKQVNKTFVDEQNCLQLNEHHLAKFPLHLV